MNKPFLNIEIQIFINYNLYSNINKLILKGSPFSNTPIQEIVNQIISKKKSREKLPTWFSTKQIIYPSKISIEQTSSEITAKYKSTLISGKNLVDITGGFGVDTFYFSKTFDEVTHCEINEELSEIVAHNYKQLGVKNITTIATNGLDFLKNSTQKFDCIYIDPSRRNDAKGKVFLLKDCSPNVPENLDFLFSKSDTILIKNSPMLDISNGINELKFVKEIHVVAVKNEVKELLFLLEKGYTKNIEIKTVNIRKNNIQKFEFQNNTKQEAIYSEPLSYLYEPNVAILKSGAFHQVSSQLNIAKLQEHSHLYTSNDFIEDFPGRKFTVISVFNYNKKQFKKNFTQQKANISIRNFPKSVAQIRKETKLNDGGDTYLFFTKNNNGKLIVIETSQIFAKTT